MRKYLYYILLSIIPVCISGCARVGHPGGGPKDVLPPVLIRSNPPDKTLNFHEPYITLYFDEYVQINDLRDNLIISPPMTPLPEISPLGTASKFIRIKIKDSLRKNTTYVMNFGDAVSDYTEKNILKNLTYVFSTGNTLDTLKLKGKILPSYYKEKPENITALLYRADKNYTDSVSLKRKPDYIARVGKDGAFEFNFISPGTYKLLAIGDAQNNYHYDLGEEPVGFVEDAIQIPTDSVYTFALFYDKKPPDIPIFKNLSYRHFIVGYTGDKPPVISKTSAGTPGKDYVYFKDETKDTLHLWTAQPVKDSLKIFCTLKDSLIEKRLRILHSSAKDTLLLKMKSNHIPVSLDSITLSSNQPLVAAQLEKIALTLRDSIPVPFTGTIRQNHLITIKFSNKIPGKYRITLLPGAVQGITGMENDTLRMKFFSDKKEIYGSLVLETEQNPEKPFIIQLLDKNNGEIIREKMIHSPGQADFPLLKPGEYKVRIITDKNENGKWDTGNYLKKIQPEPVYYLPQTLKIKPNWTIRQKIIGNYP